MKCPVCNDVRMREVEKDGVLIDVCPDCKGVWLDRGELEKLLQEINDIRPSYREWEESRGHAQDPYSKHNHKGYPKHKRKKNVLDVFGDLFD